MVTSAFGQKRTCALRRSLVRLDGVVRRPSVWQRTVEGNRGYVRVHPARCQRCGLQEIQSRCAEWDLTVAPEIRHVESAPRIVQYNLFPPVDSTHTRA